MALSMEFHASAVRAFLPSPSRAQMAHANLKGDPDTTTGPPKRISAGEAEDGQETVPSGSDSEKLVVICNDQFQPQFLVPRPLPPRDW